MRSTSARSFLAGFKAQRYQVELREGFREAQDRMAGAIEQTVRQEIGGDEQQIHSMDAGYSVIHFKHLLLPVWTDHPVPLSTRPRITLAAASNWVA